MKSFLSKNWRLLSILTLSAFIRFGGLSWCLPYIPHPDEWNMASAITRLDWKEKLNPHFFAYGQFPLYLAYFSSLIYNLIPWIKIQRIDIPEAIFFLRFWSSLAGIGTVYLVYLISQELNFSRNQKWPLLAALLAAFTPGLIQISHFGTTEAFLSLFLLFLIYLSFKIQKTLQPKYFFLSGIVLGLSLGTKISALTFAVPIIIPLIACLKKILIKDKEKLSKLLGLSVKFILLLLVATLTTAISSPHLILSFSQTKSTLFYETRVATGQVLVFYTRQFLKTTPILFQAEKTFPFALGWPIFILGTGGIVLSLIEIVKNFKNRSKNFTFYILHFTFWSYFFSQAFLFCKWTRFAAPLFPFFAVWSTIFLSKASSLLKDRKLIRISLVLIVICSVLPGIIFSSVYFSPDIRFTASEWIFKNIPEKSKIIYDTGNVIDLPLVPPSLKGKADLPVYSTVSFDFYNLDENKELFPKLLNYLESSDYIIVPSRRIFGNHLRLPEQFPKTTKYYSLLFSGKLGFTQIKEFAPFTSQVFGDENAEETFSVFDHPTIRIFQKEVKLESKQYEKLFSLPI